MLNFIYLLVSCSILTVSLSNSTYRLLQGGVFNANMADVSILLNQGLIGNTELNSKFKKTTIKLNAEINYEIPQSVDKSPKNRLLKLKSIALAGWLFGLGVIFIAAGIIFIIDFASGKGFENWGIWIGTLLTLLGVGFFIMAFRVL